MQSRHTAWLLRLAQDGHGGRTVPSITRGKAYTLRGFVFADVSADTFTASIRLSPDAAGSTLADFAVMVGAYANDETPLTLTLTAAQTAALPADEDGDSLVELVFDILRTPQGLSEPGRFAGGNIYVSGKVT